MTPRTPLRSDFSPKQYAIVSRLGKGEKSALIMRELGMEKAIYRYHLTEAANKIPGDLPPTARIIGWWRGADRKMLGAV
jgi:hypothetical protein